MDKNLNDAVNYGADSNKLEDNNLTDKEIEKVMNDMQKTDESFLYGIIQMIRGKHKNNDEDEENVKVRK